MFLKTMQATAISLMLSQATIAQTHYNTWFRTTVSVPAGKKITVDAEWQHRRQDGFTNSNMLNKNLLFSFRNWINYKYNKQVTFSLSPFAYFSNYHIIQKLSDETAAPSHEIRFSGALMVQNEFVSRFIFTGRTAIEYRLPDNSNNIIRARERLGLGYGFSSRYKLTVFNEVLVNVMGTTKNHFFDHNRIGIDVEYKPARLVKLDLGYIYIARLPLGNIDLLNEHDIFLNLSFQLFNRD